MRQNVRVFTMIVALVSPAACSDIGGPAESVRMRPGAPPFWFGGTAQPSLYEVGTNVGVSWSGTSSAYLRSTTSAIDSTSFAHIGQGLSAAAYRGRRVRYTAYVRTDSLVGQGAGLWMRVDGPTGYFILDNMIDYGRPITGFADWTRHSVVLDVPSDAVGIVIGALLKGRGTMRLDDAELETVDASVPVTLSGRFSIVRDSALTTNYYLSLPSLPLNADFEGGAFSDASARVSSWYIPRHF